ncbi:hypothetical protein FQN57_006997 [Myotisia sp. PD_48]|nr:hypothetical protein FQN57_006997 [Myotisia sp. PD_48]
MLRPKPSSSLQKTYDDTYLTCSTAVYFEQQNNEVEALRSWKSALDAIYHHNAHKVSATYVPKTETERLLKESLQELETQCRERIDILETLKESRKEGSAEFDSSKPSSIRRLEKTRSQTNGALASSSGSLGFIGDGTIPSLGYPDLSRPPALPPRPSFQNRTSFDMKPNSKSQSQPQTPNNNSSGAISGAGMDFFPPSSPSPTLRNSTTPTHEATPEKKRTLLSTLRGKDAKSSSRKSKSPKDSRPAAASKAAGLAWSIVPDFNQRAIKQSPPGNESPGASTPRKSNSSESVPRKEQRKSFGDDIPALNRPYNRPETSPGSRLTANDRIATRLAAGAAAGAAYKSGESSFANGPTDAPTPGFKVHDKPSNTPASNSKPHPKSTKKPSAGLTPRIKIDSAPSKSNYHEHKPTRHVRGDDNDHHATIKSRQRSDPLKPSSRRPETARQRTISGSSKESRGKEAIEEEDDQSLSDLGEADSNSLESMLKRLPRGVDTKAAKQIFNEIVVRGDQVHWDDVAGLEPAKKALKEAVVYPFLRPDLFMGLREPASGMLLFGPPGTGKTMLARAVATESKSTFFSVSASSLSSKWHGESEKLVRALFALAKVMAPSIIFVDEIDALLSSRSKPSEGEASRRSKTEFLIQWSDLQRAAAGREHSEKDKKQGDASRVLVLAATNMPWDIDEAARRRFVRRQYIPLPEDHVRKLQFQKLLSHQKHDISNEDIDTIVKITEGFSGSDITALAKDAAMGPLRNLGEDLLYTPMDKIPAITFKDFETSLGAIRPSVNHEGLKKYEEWAKQFGERGG